MGYRDLLRAPAGEESESVRERVMRARTIQASRFGTDVAPRRPRAPFSHERCNARMDAQEVRRWVGVDAAGQALLERAVESLALSARAHDRIRRVARTLADLEGADAVKSRHLAEAIHYRALDRPAG